MTDLTSQASMHQEHTMTLRDAILSVKQQAKADGATRTVALAMDVIELIIRSQQERLRQIEDTTSKGTELKGFSSMRQEHLNTLNITVKDVKTEATKGSTTHTIATAFEAIEVMLRDHEKRLIKLEAALSSKL